MIAIDISKQLALDANQKTIQQINFINDLECNTNPGGNFSFSGWYISQVTEKVL